MKKFCENPFSSKNGRVLKVVIVARISTDHQDPRSLADHVDACCEYLKEHFDGRVEVHVIQSKGSGEHLDRRELFELEDFIESGKFDVVIVEDLGRICRRKRAYDFCELCVDHETRLIAMNDRVDTAEEGWEDAAFFATWHHERSNRDTSKRIKRSLVARFDRGQLLERQSFGIVVPEGAKTDAELQKDPIAEKAVPEMLHRLEHDASFAEVADWLNSQGIARGPYARRKTWKGRDVSRYVFSGKPIGRRVWNRRITKRHHKSGHHLAKTADVSLHRVRECPNLAYVEKPYWEYVVRLLQKKNECHNRTKPGEVDTRKNVSRKRTTWPGQQARCSTCGRPMYWSMDGNQRTLLCSGAVDYVCWQALSISGKLVIQRVGAEILALIRQLAGFDQELQKKLRGCLDDSAQRVIREQVDLQRQLATRQAKLGRLISTIEVSASPQTAEPLLKRVAELQDEISELEFRLSELKQPPAENLTIPSVEDLSELIQQAFLEDCLQDPETGRLLSRLVPEFFIQPYRLCDDNFIVARAHIKVVLPELLPAEARAACDGNVWVRHLAVDLFDPPQRVRLRRDIVSLKDLRIPERRICKDLSITRPVVQQAMSLTREMTRQGIDDPYVPVFDVPTDITKLRRHLHPRFRFEPLSGFPLKAFIQESA